MGTMVLKEVPGCFLMKFQEMNPALTKTSHKSVSSDCSRNPMRFFHNNILIGDVYGVNTVFFGNKAPIFKALKWFLLPGY
jgi:hypothetical protein